MDKLEILKECEEKIFELIELDSCNTMVEQAILFGYKKALDDNNILYGDDEERFVKNMIETKNREPTDKEIELAKKIQETKLNLESS